MKKTSLILFSVFTLLLTGCGTVPLVVTTLTVSPEHAAVFSPETLSPVFRKNGFGGPYQHREDRIILYRDRRSEYKKVINWDRGHRHTYSLGQIACDHPYQLILLSHDLGVSEKIIAELTSLLVRQNIKYDYRVETENVKDITVFMRNHSAVTPEQVRYHLRVEKAIRNLEKKKRTWKRTGPPRGN